MMTGRPSEDPFKVLFLSTYEGTDASAVRDYLLSFRLDSRHDYYYVLDCRRLDGRIDLRSFDVIVILWDVYLLGLELADAARADRPRAGRRVEALGSGGTYGSAARFRTMRCRSTTAWPT